MVGFEERLEFHPSGETLSIRHEFAVRPGRHAHESVGSGSGANRTSAEAKHLSNRALDRRVVREEELEAALTVQTSNIRSPKVPHNGLALTGEPLVLVERKRRAARPLTRPRRSTRCPELHAVLRDLLIKLTRCALQGPLTVPVEDLIEAVACLADRLLVLIA